MHVAFKFSVLQIFLQGIRLNLFTINLLLTQCEKEHAFDFVMNGTEMS